MQSKPKKHKPITRDETRPNYRLSRECVKNIHDLSKRWKIPKSKTVEYAISAAILGELLSKDNLDAIRAMAPKLDYLIECYHCDI